jgi:hypothetical protein
MKKRLIIILSTIAMSIMLGYLFFLSLLLGILASKYVAGGSVGERGKVRSIIVPFIRWRIHFHHWLYSLWLMGFSFATGIYFLTPIITYGLLSGVTFQGIYSYNDWHVILIKRHKIGDKAHLPAASKDGAYLETEHIGTFREIVALEE